MANVITGGAGNDTLGGGRDFYGAQMGPWAIEDLLEHLPAAGQDGVIAGAAGQNVGGRRAGDGVVAATAGHVLDRRQGIFDGGGRTPATRRSGDEVKPALKLKGTMNLVPIMRLTQLERKSVRLKGERGQLIASTAQARGKMTETELQIIQIDQDLRSEVAKELREIQGKMAELVERKVAAEDQLMRTDIRAPQSGVVHQLNVHTVGGVITASEPAMLIVPEMDDLTVEVKLPPQNIDQLLVGQPAVLRFSAFNQRRSRGP